MVETQRVIPQEELTAEAAPKVRRWTAERLFGIVTVKGE